MEGQIIGRAVVGFLAVVALVGYSGDAQAFGSASVQVVATTGAPGTAAPPLGSQTPPTEEELLNDVDVAVQVVNDYWNRHWPEFFTGTYQPPVVSGLYDSASGGGPTCGGLPAVPDNAFYCASGEDFVAWDRQLILQGAEHGDAWVYLIVAHEWAHAIQYRLDPSLQILADELQADCMAGAVLYGAARDGTLIFEDGDEQEIVRGLAQLADKTPWTMQSDHGSALERAENFALGRAGGVNACLPIA